MAFHAQDGDGGSPTEPLARRTVVKAAAWAVPVIAVAAAVPAMAASPAPAIAGLAFAFGGPDPSSQYIAITGFGGGAYLDIQNTHEGQVFTGLVMSFLFTAQVSTWTADIAIDWQQPAVVPGHETEVIDDVLFYRYDSASTHPSIAGEEGTTHVPNQFSFTANGGGFGNNGTALRLRRSATSVIPLLGPTVVVNFASGSYGV